MNIEIANRLVQLRKQSHLSQEELASLLGISRQAVSKWERAESSPDTDNLILLAKLYNISIDELLQTGGPIPAPPAAPEPPVEPEPPQPVQPAAGEPEKPMDGCSQQAAPKAGQRPPAQNSRTEPLREKTSVSSKTAAAPVIRDAKMDAAWPIIVLIIFLVLGFFFRLWHPGWMVFFLIPIYYVRGKSLKAFYPLLVLGIFFVLGFVFRLWHPGWMVFLTIPLYYIFLSK